MYTQGQKWQDGCKYTCECVNANIGLHNCIQRYIYIIKNAINLHFKTINICITDMLFQLKECGRSLVEPQSGQTKDY